MASDHTRAREPVGYRVFNQHGTLRLVVRADVADEHASRLRADDPSTDHEAVYGPALLAAHDALAAQVAQMRELAEHLRHCRECGETDVENCPEGWSLWSAALAQRAAPAPAAPQPDERPAWQQYRDQQVAAQMAPMYAALSAPAAPAEPLPEPVLDDGEAWSFCRKVMSDGRDVALWHPDEGYERQSARMDASAAKRGDELMAIVAAAIAAARQQMREQCAQEAEEWGQGCLPSEIAAAIRALP